MKFVSGLKKMLLVSLLLVPMAAVPGSPLFAAEVLKPTGDLTVSALSQYIWRGYEMSRHSIVVQPSLTLGYNGFSANLWGNLDTSPYSPTGASHASKWNETDFTLAYAKTVGLFNIGGSYAYYSLPALNQEFQDRNDAQELSVSVGLNTLLSPTLTIYKEFTHYRNWYATLGISHIFALNEAASLKLAATASYLLSTDADTYPKFDGNSVPTTEKFNNFHDGSLSASLPVRATEHITVTPIISYVFPLSSDAKNEMKGFGLAGTASPADRDSSFFYGGMSVSFSF